MNSHTYDIWYNLPNTATLQYKIIVEGPTANETIAIAQYIWDMLNAKEYLILARP